MLISTTSLSDGIAVVVFATILFLILLGLVVLVRWIFRSLFGIPSPESVILVFANTIQEEEDEHADGSLQNLENFSWLLHTKLRDHQLGHFDRLSYEGEETLVFFKGTDANRIWELIHAEARDHAPAIPMRVILERSKKHGGQRIIEPVEWRISHTLFPQPAPPTIPETWIRLSICGNMLTLVGSIGLFAWGFLRKWIKLSENEFRDTDLGNYSAWTIGVILILGLFLKLLSHIRFRRLARQAGFPSNDSPTSTILKYVLLLVIGIFAAILLLVT